MTVPALFQQIADKHPEVVCQYSRDGEKKQFLPITYKELYRIIEALAWSLQKAGISKEDHIGLISDNRKEWLALDLAILSLGAVDVPRGCDTMPQELEYILGFSECGISVIENLKQFEKIQSSEDKLKKLKKMILIDDESEIPESRFEVLKYKDLLEEGMEKAPEGFLRELITLGDKDDLATIIFTSGTTGEPKGVMLSHENFMHQIRNAHTQGNFDVGDIWLSVLPVWHCLERALEYIALGAVNTIAYSKPIGKIMLIDLQTLNPQWMVAVPRIWTAIEGGVRRNVNSKGPVARGLFSFFMNVAKAHQFLQNHMQKRVPQYKARASFLDYIWMPIPWLLLYPFRRLGDKLIFSKIKEKVGNRFKAGLTGGGALPLTSYVFFDAVGIQLLEGYGLTETAPVAAFSPHSHPITGMVKTWPDTEIKLVDENGQKVKTGEKGVLMIRGAQVMKGYYKKPELTDAVLDKEGWLNSGDLGVMSLQGYIRIVGRAKDTVVLLGGENIEPVPMEQRLALSPYIEQAVVVGQDQKYLAALIVPDFDALEAYAKENNLPYENRVHLRDVHAILELLNSEISGLVSAKNGFRSFERIFKFAVLRKPFEVGEELSGKLDLKRHSIAEIYKEEIKSLFK
jgi:long-chain acyl-CoA synthetase